MPRFKLEAARRMREQPTPAERILWSAVRNSALGFRVRRQAPMWGYIADFYVARAGLVIEVDGGYHRAEVDQARDLALLGHGLRTLRVSNDLVMSDLPFVLGRIRAEVSHAAP